ncbi:Fcf1-domain-containing protein [Xylariales sp. AK1849]|nr:Fcf1-domain-containing protein [Xylariales sp. AK1849]
MPRARRAKQYRKLMQQFGMSFGFREPYQFLIDAQLLSDACRFKMDLVRGLEQTVSGKVHLFITQCSMRHLYNSKAEPGVSAAIELGKTFERRRCGHHPSEYPEPLSTLECLTSVVDPKGNGVNKHRYCVASNDQETRAALRLVNGVPLVYISRSVMIMEPMAEATANQRTAAEKQKLRDEIKRFAGKRKRVDDVDEETEDGTGQSTEPERKQRNKAHGPKGPNPLSVKKKKPKPTLQEKTPRAEVEASVLIEAEGTEERKRSKRKRKPKAQPHGDRDGDDDGETVTEVGSGEHQAALRADDSG